MLMTESVARFEVGGVQWHQLKQGQKVLLAEHDSKFLTIREIDGRFALFSEDESSSPFPTFHQYGDSGAWLANAATLLIVGGSNV
jgi:hypothetical protein